MKTYSLSLFVSVLLSFLVLEGCASVHQHQVLSADHVRISYDVQGAGKPALVFVHGWCCDKRYWNYQVSHFAQQHQVVTIDLAGHGASGYGRAIWTMEAFGEDVASVIETLDLEQVILIGHSMGGFVIIEAARHVPGRVIGLVGVDTLHDVEAEYPREQIEEFIMAFKKDFAANARTFVHDMFRSDSDPNVVERIAEDMSSTPSWIGIGALREYFNYDVQGALKDVRVPIFCINTDLLPTNVEANRRHALSFDVKMMPGMSHFIMIEDPNHFNRLLDETIGELLSQEKIPGEKEE